MCENNKTTEKCENCIAEILTVINVLQQNATCCGESCLDTCDRGFLGCSTASLNCNTRPVMLFTCCGNGTPWSMPTTKEDINCNTCNETCSNVFRVEKVDNNCATFRVLAKNCDEKTKQKIPFITTNSFFTMNLDCCCAIKCLQDTFVDCL